MTQPDIKINEYSVSILTQDPKAEAPAIAEEIQSLARRLGGTKVELRSHYGTIYGDFGDIEGPLNVFVLRATDRTPDHVVLDFDPPFRPTWLNIRDELAKTREIRPRLISDRFSHSSLPRI